jgi:hypothetical protein
MSQVGQDTKYLVASLPAATPFLFSTVQLGFEPRERVKISLEWLILIDALGEKAQQLQLQVFGT